MVLCLKARESRLLPDFQSTSFYTTYLQSTLSNLPPLPSGWGVFLCINAPDCLFVGYFVKENPQIVWGFSEAYSYTSINFFSIIIYTVRKNCIDERNFIMDKYSLSHTTWCCKYHIVFTPKYRRKTFYGITHIQSGVQQSLYNKT